MKQAQTIRIAADGGGSGCRVAVCDGTGAILGRGTGPAANVASDFDAAITALSVALDAARRDAGVDPDRFAAAPSWLGLAGAIDPAICARTAAALPLARAQVTEDRVIAVAGALGAGDGCLAAIGTGSFLARQASGEHAFVGGWGAVLGDEASGAWLGKRLLSRVLAWQDGLVDATPLLRDTLDRAGGTSAIAHFSFAAAPQDFARYAPAITQAAEAGDAAGRALMQDGADYITAGFVAMGWTEGEPVCLSGGLGPRYADLLPGAMQASLTHARGSMLDGAIRLALGLPD